MPKYIWSSKRIGKKVHIVSPTGMTYCKVENNSLLTAARLDATGDELPEGRLPCSICEQYHATHQRQVERVARVMAIRPSDEDQDLRFARSKAFLKSNRWAEVRYEVLKTRGVRCECCGASPRDGTTIMVDHIKPRSQYPELALDPTNLQVLCAACNRGKGNWDQTDWRAESRPEDVPAEPGSDPTSTH